MNRLPRVSGRDCIKALGKEGFRRKHQKGSHVVLRRDAPFAQVVVPDHKEHHKGTLRGILNQTGLSVEDFRKLLRR